MKFNSSRITLALLLTLGITAGDSIAKAEFEQNESSLHRNETVLRQKAIAQGYQLAHPQIDPQDLEQETYLYQVSVKNPTTWQFENFCSPDQDGVAKAMLLPGSWSETGEHIRDNNITVACTSGVIAKCVRWGYKPWQKVNGVSLWDHHQACTRMARADYCGNGSSHTKDGTLIDVYDSLKIRRPEQNRDLPLEAAWGVNGALKLNHTRYPETLTQLQRECPEKLEQIYAPDNIPFSNTNQAAQIPSALIFNNSQNSYP